MGTTLSPQPTKGPDCPLSSIAMRNILTVCGAGVELGGIVVAVAGTDVGKEIVFVAEGSVIVTVGSTCLVGEITTVAVSTEMGEVAVTSKVGVGSTLTSNVPQAGSISARHRRRLFNFIRTPI